MRCWRALLPSSRLMVVLDARPLPLRSVTLGGSSLMIRGRDGPGSLRGMDPGILVESPVSLRDRDEPMYGVDENIFDADVLNPGTGARYGVCSGGIDVGLGLLRCERTTGVVGAVTVRRVALDCAELDVRMKGKVGSVS